MIQVELLTYRRTHRDGLWISSNVSLQSIENWLKGRTEILQSALVEEGMIRELSPCGWFLTEGCVPGKSCLFLPLADEVFQRYFMNMDIYRRASFLDESCIDEMWAEES